MMVGKSKTVDTGRKSVGRIFGEDELVLGQKKAGAPMENVHEFVV